MKLLVNNSFTIRHVLTNPEANPIYINDATVTATIKDLKGVDVTGPTWPTTLAYVAASNGVYEAPFVPIAALVINKWYRVHIDATGSGGTIGHWEIKVKASIK